MLSTLKWGSQDAAVKLSRDRDLGSSGRSMQTGNRVAGLFVFSLEIQVKPTQTSLNPLGYFIITSSCQGLPCAMCLQNTENKVVGFYWSRDKELWDGREDVSQHCCFVE